MAPNVPRMGMAPHVPLVQTGSSIGIPTQGVSHGIQDSPPTRRNHGKMQWSLNEAADGAQWLLHKGPDGKIKFYMEDLGLPPAGWTLHHAADSTFMRHGLHLSWSCADLLQVRSRTDVHAFSDRMCIDVISDRT